MEPVTTAAVELCDAASVAELLGSVARPKTRLHVRLRGERLAGVRPPVMRPRHCSCGACHSCAENQRWNRIFEEKFADPTYYSGPMIRHSSALNSIA
ncbi:MAG TPA: hypothetical protein VML19_12625 [Verrucomicrobiae bacterium]|nr:hypothetical protein [Verrucomicrobiae bacterium]